MEQWLVFELAEQKYAVNVEYVKEMTPAKGHALCQLPEAPPHVVGAMNLRGSVISVVDLRTLLGMPSLARETDNIIEMLDQREQDHVNWIAELESSVRQERAFRLATDPHKCAFGKWYDALVGDKRAMERFTNGDTALEAIVVKFDLPHQRIHNIAHRVTDLVTNHQTEEAFAVIEQTRDGDLAAMVHLFGEARRMIRDLRSAMIAVVTDGSTTLGVQIDAIESVIRLQKDQMQDVDPAFSAGNLIIGTAQLDGFDGLLLLLDGSQFFEDRHSGKKTTPTQATPQSQRQPQPQPVSC